MKKKEIKRQQICKEKKNYNKMVQKVKDVFKRKSNIGDMMILELTSVCKPHKTKADRTMPKQKPEVMEAYLLWSQRSPPAFGDKSSNSCFEDVVDAIPITSCDDDDNMANDEEINNETVMQVANV